jgi:hypothetical protein
MNDTWISSPPAGRLTDGEVILSCVPLVPHSVMGPGVPAQTGLPLKKPGSRPAAKKEPGFLKDARFAIWRDGAVHIISESYFYKTEPYYTILQHELEGRPVRPASSAVLDAYVVPVCLERASLAGIPVCSWEISQGYLPLPSVVYGLNYFATTADYFVVDNNEKAKETIKHITNKGKYPFCYQKLPDNATITSCISIFGRTVTGSDPIDTIASQVYDLFAIPLVTIVMVQGSDGLRLSSLSPTKYTQLSGDERSLLSAYISHQEFL